MIRFQSNTVPTPIPPVISQHQCPQYPPVQLSNCPPPHPPIWQVPLFSLFLLHLGIMVCNADAERLS